MKIVHYTHVYLLGYAIKKLFPKAKMVSGSIIGDRKFYYDIDIDYILTKEHLNVLEKIMFDFIQKNCFFLKKCVSWREAYSIFAKKNEDYKICILETIKKNDYLELCYYGSYVDICCETQIMNMKFCYYFQLKKSTSGTFWYGKNGSRKILQRIYGIALSKNEKEINFYFQNTKKEKNRDHRKIGKNFDLYHIQEEASGMVFWHHDGWIIFRELENFIREKLKEFNYYEVKTPIMLNRCLWEKTGHWDYYSENMFDILSENQEYCMKPMNCPCHVQIFNRSLRSYRELPFRVAEFGYCHRNEPSGSLYGLMRLRSFTQDDAHIFCTKKQVKEEVINCIKMMNDTYSVFGFKKFIVKLSTKPDKYIGSDNIWKIMEENLITVLLENNIDFEYQPGKGAFYGPKIEFSFFDCFNREWQCGTIQLDFLLSSRLNIFYVNKNNKKSIPIIIHRAILGSIERFIAILTEEFSGSYPTWLSPTQVIVMSITNDHLCYVSKVVRILSKLGIRTKEDIRNEKIAFKIREHTLRKVPYMLICGKKEIENNTVSIRTRCGKNLKNIEIYKFIDQLKNEIKNRNLCMGEFKY
ncbi:Threonine--tRNA ligase [Candidatus Westeberhardia cardiocondylae]|uniref:Threonine--tRNA ligase n=1 Tax=Candidatus Westeberhardia cardiocondylae TaxID=1594731 RepID=A0A0H5BWY0_9ENTR|nr:threonine--tRNA ligase [Candidatus Westeberhardia cardiocondylae]CEN32227.1 Threonine--tRNA ligase [Candidatus Westeberhardia cardiocondylae]